MTAPACKQPLHPAIVDMFDAYHQRQLAWGIFHVCLDDGNWKHGAAQPTTDEEIQLLAIFDRLSPSQRRKLAGMIDDRDRERRKARRG